MFESFLAAGVVTLISLIGVLFFGNAGYLKGTHRFIVPVAIGVFLGVVFFELIPETLEGSEFYGAVAIAVGFLSFYILSHYLRTYHHHHHDHSDECRETRGASLLLLGDSVHNIADGVVIASAFLINPAVGIAATVGIALHEVPQEIAEYGVLTHAGYTRKEALLYNFLSASSIFVGVALCLIFAGLGDFVWILTGLAAGNLLYIAASDMIPELSHTTEHDHFVTTFISTLLGLIAIVALLTWSHGHFEGEEESHSESTMRVELLE